MRKILSRDEVAGLTEEQKDAYARVVLADAGLRRQLESKASGYRGGGIVPVPLAIVGLALFIWTPSLEVIVIIGLLAVAGALQWQTQGLNSRLDGVLELLKDLDRRAEELEREAGLPAVDEEANRPKSE